VLNIAGEAIALHAAGAGHHATTDFYLPLDRPERALKHIQEYGIAPPRGTIQTMVRNFILWFRY
jgi:hypothetical protein